MITDYLSTRNTYLVTLALCLMIVLFSNRQTINRSERSTVLVEEAQQPCRGDPYLRSAPRKLIYKPRELKEYKKILIWNEFFSELNFRFGLGLEPFERNKCQVQNCFLTTDRTMFQNEEIAAVLLFYDPRVYDKFDQSPLPVLSDHTMNVFVMLEYPGVRNKNNGNFRNNYNWTYTYRTDSDFKIPYGIMEAIDEDSQKSSSPTKNFALGKTKFATWISSHCSSVFDHEKYVKTLQQYIPVDVYGKCGNLTCPKFIKKGCLHYIYNNYKFLLDLENSVCKDDVSEKTFRTIMSNIIPVGFGLGYDKIGLPENSYIDAFSFESVEDLSNYLKYLDSNDTAYNEYFAWKEKFRITGKWMLHRRSMCDLCASLHQMDPKSPYAKHLDVTKEAASGFPVASKTLNTQTTARIAQQYPKYHNRYNDVQKWMVETSECLSYRKNDAFKEFLDGATKTELRAKYTPSNPRYSFIHKPNLQWRIPEVNDPVNAESVRSKKSFIEEIGEDTHMGDLTENKKLILNMNKKLPVDAAN